MPFWFNLFLKKMKNYLISCFRFLEALFCCRRQENGFIGFQPNESNREKGQERVKTYASDIDSSRQAVFQTIYDKNVWGKGIEGSGEGSTIGYTTVLRKHLLEFVSLYNISSMADIPCGFMRWTEVFLNSVWKEKPNFAYTGMDIAKSVVEKLQEKWKGDNRVTVKVADLSSSLPPIKADFTLTRDALQHLSLKDSCLAIKNLIDLGDNIKYVLIGMYPKTVINKDTKTGSYYSVNVMRNPFNFPEPHFVFKETPDNNLQKYIYGFKMKDIQNHKCKICQLYGVDTLHHPSFSFNFCLNCTLVLYCSYLFTCVLHVEDTNIFVPAIKIDTYFAVLCEGNLKLFDSLQMSRHNVTFLFTIVKTGDINWIDFNIEFITNIFPTCLIIVVGI
ncbi:hypothetical protein KUTeg_023664, partial [Tegillarca granosa]